jgi:ferredoxin
MLTNIVQKHLTPSDDFIFGTADLRGLVDEKFGDHQYGIAIGRRLDDTVIDSIAEGPTLEYFNLYTGINSELARITEKIAIDLRKAGTGAIPITPTVHTGPDSAPDYIRTLKADVSHKMVATRAGLGWIGKTDLFVSKKFGPRLRLVSILINKEPEFTAAPVEESLCGKCNICVEKCPAKAATGELWNIRLHRDAFFDAKKCREMCAEMGRTRLHADRRICGICVSVCPFGHRIKPQA